MVLYRITEGHRLGARTPATLVWGEGVQRGGWWIQQGQMLRMGTKVTDAEIALKEVI